MPPVAYLADEECYTPNDSDVWYSEYGFARLRAEQLLDWQRETLHDGTGPGPPALEPATYQREQVAAWATSLDTKETSGFGLATVPFPESTDPQQQLAFTLWTYATNDHQRKIAHEIGGCGKYVWVALDDDGPCTIRNQCKHRQCPRCSGYRAHQIADGLTLLMDTWSRTKFITLTRKPRDCSLRETIKSLTHDFNTLRRTALWKACAGQGAFTVEITRAPQRHHWHVHLHILVDAKYIPQAALSDAWKHITKDSGVVHVRAAVPSDAKYLAKYVAKGSTAPVEDWERWAYANELHSVRLCGTFGGAASFTELKPDPHHTLIAPLVDVERWARSGDHWAQDLLEKITNRLLSFEPSDVPPQRAQRRLIE